MGRQARIYQHGDGLLRRDFVRVGGLTALGLSLTDFFKLRAATVAGSTVSPTTSVSSTSKARSCILIWLDGGPSHLETLDLKPTASAEVRGPFQPISTKIAGTQICELMPRTAGILDQAAIVRSVTSPLGEHNFGTHYLMTGYKPTPALVYPSIGTVVGHVREHSGVLPSHVAIPRFLVGGGKFSGEGFLPSSLRPFSVGGDPGKPDFRVKDLERYPLVTPARLKRRRDFLAALDRYHLGVDQADEKLSDPQFEQAYRLTTSQQAKRAFLLSEESEITRRSYGPRTIGQSCLLARRLVERGVPFVTVNNTGWDTHENIYTRLKEGYTGAKVPVGLIPSLDLAFSALVEDLRDRGMLEETLIVVMGEFGRTPKLNTAGGRDHWPRVFSVLLAGGGVPGGQVIGASDSSGESPAERPVTPADLAATIYTLLGVDPRATLHTSDGRPVQINRDGVPIKELLG